jgi:hypothetical protein
VECVLRAYFNAHWFVLFVYIFQETVEDTGSEGATGDPEKTTRARRQRYTKKTRTVVNPDENFYFYWLMVLTICVLYNLWTLIVRQSFPELQVSRLHGWTHKPLLFSRYLWDGLSHNKFY